MSDREDARRRIPLPVLRRHPVSVVCEEKMAPEKSEQAAIERHDAKRTVSDSKCFHLPIGLKRTA